MDISWLTVVVDKIKPLYDWMKSLYISHRVSFFVVATGIVFYAGIYSEYKFKITKELPPHKATYKLKKQKKIEKQKLLILVFKLKSK
jgi:hypothetical protein